MAGEKIIQPDESGMKHPSELTGDVFTLNAVPDFAMSVHDMNGSQVRILADVLDQYNRIVWMMIVAVLKHYDINADDALHSNRIYQYIPPVIGSVPPGTTDFYLDAEDKLKSKFICRAFMNVYDGKVYADFKYPASVQLTDDLQNRIEYLTETKF